MQGTNTLPIEGGDNGRLALLNEFESNAVGLLLAKGLHRSGLAIVRICCQLASSGLVVVGFLSTRLQAGVLFRSGSRSGFETARRDTGSSDIAGREIDTGSVLTGLNARAAIRAPGVIGFSGGFHGAVEALAGTEDRSLVKTSKLIVIGFMGGNVRPNNFVHREARLTQTLQNDYPETIHAEIFANRHGQQAFDSILQQLAPGGAAHLSDAVKSAARIVIFGHSWGASETVALAKRLDRIGIPVLLTIQVDSVQKKSQNDSRIPANVREAVNFYQAEGMLRGRDKIVASDPEKTAILGNFESRYRKNAISVADFPWYARAFMKPHVQIENDPTVWNKIQGLILAEIR